jgi:hypothetical protein
MADIDAVNEGEAFLQTHHARQLRRGVLRGLSRSDSS